MRVWRVRVVRVVGVVRVVRMVAVRRVAVGASWHIRQHGASLARARQGCEEARVLTPVGPEHKGSILGVQRIGHYDAVPHRIAVMRALGRACER